MIAISDQLHLNLDAVIKASTQSVTSRILNENARKRILSFIRHKEHYFFGQLAYVHGILFAGEDNRNAALIQDLHKLAAAVELYARSFDIFDDLEDQDNLEEPWMQIPHPEALNLATLMYTVSMQLFTEMDRSGLLVPMVHDYSIRAMQGQHEDLTGSAQTEEACLEMMKLKSGSLIAMASMAGVLYSTHTFLTPVEEYSIHFGIAAQIDNDFRDLFHSHKSDLVTKKNTLAKLYIGRKFNSQSEDLLGFFESGLSYSEMYGSVDSYKSMLLKAGVIPYLNVMKQISIQKAILSLNKLSLTTDQIEIIKSHLIK